MIYLICQESEILKKLAKSWNNLDSSFIENELADDLIYESQWVLTPIIGKSDFLSYLKAKFIAIKNTMLTQSMTLTAEIGFQPSMDNKPCIVLTQITQNSIRQVCLLIEIQESKVRRIDVCFIPNPAEAELTGDFPK